MKLSFSPMRFFCIILSFVDATCVNQNLSRSPAVRPIGIGMELPACSQNRILEIYNVTIQNEPTDSESLIHANIAFYQGVGSCGNRTLYVQLHGAQSFPSSGTDPLYLVISRKARYSCRCELAPIFYTVFGDLWTLDEENTNGDRIVLEAANGYGSNPCDAYAMINELDHACGAVYTVTEDTADGTLTLTAELASDVLAGSGTLSVVAVIPQTSTTTASIEAQRVRAAANTSSAEIPSSTYTISGIPSNLSSTVACIRRMLKKAAKSTVIHSSEISKMAFSAFTHEVGSYFKCDRQCCKRNICDNEIYVEYLTFVTSCIQLIAASEVCWETPIVFCKGTTNNTCAAINQDICRHVRGSDWSGISCWIGGGGAGYNMCVEAQNLFDGVCTGWDYTPVVTGVDVSIETLIEFETALQPCDELTVESSFSSEEDEETKKKKRAPRKTRSKVKTSTKVSAYGWYVAGGVVTVSVAVLVYMFVL